MASKRMIAKMIVDSDAFLDMPQSTQNLYFHLNVRADDDGFIDNPKKIMRTVGSNQNDLEILLSKRYLLMFDSGVLVIKHWRLHNTIQKDRYTETKYLEEKSTLVLKRNGTYTERDNIRLLPGEVEEINSIDRPEWQTNRENAYKESTLPYNFNYKIRLAFDGRVCPMCGVVMKGYKGTDNKRPTVQHNTPISKGGKHEIENISVICRSCNESIKDNITDELNNSEVVEVWNAIVNKSSTNRDIDKIRLDKNSIDENIPEILIYWQQLYNKKTATTIIPPEAAREQAFKLSQRIADIELLKKCADAFFDDSQGWFFTQSKTGATTKKVYYFKSFVSNIEALVSYVQGQKKTAIKQEEAKIPKPPLCPGCKKPLFEAARGIAGCKKCKVVFHYKNDKWIQEGI